MLPNEERSSLFQSIFTLSPDAIVFIDPNLVVRAANENYARQVNLPVEKIRGRPMAEVSPGWMGQVHHILREVRRTGKPFHGKSFPFVFKDDPKRGTTYWDIGISPVYGANSNFIGYLLLHREVTEREGLLSEVDAERRLFQTAIENAPVGIAVLRGPNFVFELVNPTYQSIAPGKALLGRTVAEAWPELASQVLPLLERVVYAGEPYRAVDAPLPIQRSPGVPVEQAYFTFTYIPLHGPAGQVDTILVLVIETTEQVYARQKAEELAVVAERRAAELEGIIGNMVDGVFVCDTKRRITLVNEAGVRLLGMAGPEEVKRSLAEFPKLLRIRHPDGSQVDPHEMPLARALAGQPVVMEDQIVYNLRTQRDMVIRTNASPIRDRTGKIVGAVEVDRDVTDLVELDRLKDQFITVAAHELKTPVTGIRGYAQLLLRWEHEGISPRGLKALETINRQTNRISRLVNELLEVSRIQTGRLELRLAKFDLSELAAEALERMKIATEKHRLLFQSSGPVFVNADRERIEQVIGTLVDNAIRFSPQGGDIETTVRTSQGRTGGEGVVSVRDYGVGIPKDKQSRIFERFYRAHTDSPYDYGAMGIGLFIAKEIVTRHGGRIWFESQEGKGSTFYFSLPIA